MLLNLSEVMTRDGMILKKNIIPDMSNFRHGGENYPIVNCSSLNLSAVNLKKGFAKLDGNMEITFLIPCDRCLTDVKKTIHVEFEKEICAPSYVSEDMQEEQLHEMQENFMEGYNLNIEHLIYSEIIVKWPFKVLCMEQCKGICTICGQNLNEGTCTCDDFVPDPRLASIKDIFNANKEV
jgi:uncharacterized protein